MRLLCFLSCIHPALRLFLRDVKAERLDAATRVICNSHLDQVVSSTAVFFRNRDCELRLGFNTLHRLANYLKLSWLQQQEQNGK